ncbi:hypothetical protein AB0I10_37750 [Streptomyces sp. NPDC050636]|uniref:hypothetical protein n=1 Tax=Streptomyces sp. NPDC050636 TaxID=3154510 RepID=UPI003432C72D
MKSTKVAAVIACSGMALGVASPAFADDVVTAPLQSQLQDKQLLDSDTLTKQDLKNPIGDLDVKALVGSIDKVADKLKANNDIQAATPLGDTTKAVSPVSMVGGLPVGTPLG